MTALQGSSVHQYALLLLMPRILHDHLRLLRRLLEDYDMVRQWWLHAISVDILRWQVGDRGKGTPKCFRRPYTRGMAPNSGREHHIHLLQ